MSAARPQPRDWLKSRILDLVMRLNDELRAPSLELAAGEVLEVGFGTGLNLAFYPPGVKSVTGVDPLVASGFAPLEERVARVPFCVERHALRADGSLPFDAGRFDCVVTTWTLCSIPRPLDALAEMRRVLKRGGSYVFVEHGRSDCVTTARWQDRLNPLWRRLADGCNLNLAIDALVREGGFELFRLERFEHAGPRILTSMYRGAARRAD
ncbi:MAG TPA: class I SAM-dependent methyltransferase [Myxococcota bacterium]